LTGMPQRNFQDALGHRELMHSILEYHRRICTCSAIRHLLIIPLFSN
jgi:hypothetical protein